MHIPADGLVI